MTTQTPDLPGRIDQLDREVLALKEQWKQFGDAQAIVVPISTFDPEPFELLKEIKIVVQPDDDTFVATFFDANVNASGNTQVDAVANLKDMMTSLFELLESQEHLGKGPARQWAVLRGLMRRKA